jgi:hypothetical protein
MPHNRSLQFDGRIAVVVVWAIFGPMDASAQRVAVNMIVVDAQHDLLGDPLAGLGITARFRPDRRFSIHLRAEHARGAAERTGRPCTAFGDPAPCPPEPMEDKSWLSIATAGFAGRLLGNRERSVAVTADVSLGRVHVDSRGMSSGRILTNSRSLLGASIGIVGTWRIPTTPLSLQLSGDVGALGGIPNGLSYIGVSPPFEGDFGVRRSMISVNWVR